MAAQLESDPRYRRLTTITRKASVIQSCLSDLAQAADCCGTLEALRQSPRKRGTYERNTTEKALLAFCVTLYVRATSTSGKGGERGAISISAKLSAEQLSDHEALVRVRNRALAHVYADEPINDAVWHQERLFLVEAGIGWRPAPATRRLQFHRPTLDRLRRQIPVAREIIVAKFHEKISKLTAILAEQPVPLTIFEENLIDPVEFFGSVRGVEDALAGMPFGMAKGLA